MLLEFIATISAGVGAAGIILGLQKVTKSNFPKWLMPSCAGVAMLAFSVWSDYSWASRAEQNLGTDPVVAVTIDKRQVWRPWTFIVPVTTRFIALERDGAEIKGETVVTEMYLASRREQSAIVPVAFDCHELQRAEATGLPEGAWTEDDLATLAWIDVEEDDPTLRTACGMLR
ncbi:hypothetical protein [Celeribacter litoreus]|uniref:hypothetical protein n=1 Tax=Celeribacter litoreus TaxID=2876714 RepID=UPI001CCBA85D|nr:hypothetical protein [Celeribacter litoreus]MCA0042207.1 hypothetical protein [Celeribacter litoreus]